MRVNGLVYSPMYDAINAIAWESERLREKAIEFIEEFSKKRHIENTMPLEYTDMAAVYLRKKIDTQYRRIVKPLLHAGIVESTGYYRVGYHSESGYVKGQCLSYRLNPDLLSDDLVPITYRNSRKYQKSNDYVVTRSKAVLRQLRLADLGSRDIVRFVRATLTDDRIRRMLSVDDEIKDQLIFLKGKPYPIPRNKVRLGKRQLIKDGKYCHVDHVDHYIQRKRRVLIKAYSDQLLRIKKRNIYADRNDTNYRLDSNVTNLKSDYISLLSIDGEGLSQIDLKNSQFRIFVHLLEACERQIINGRQPRLTDVAKLNLEKAANQRFALETEKEGGKERKPVTLLLLKMLESVVEYRGSMPCFSRDYVLFKKLVKSGKLYEYIQQKYWEDTGCKLSRAEAKGIMFSIAFSSPCYHSQQKDFFSNHFPSILAVIDGFKRSRMKYLGKGRSKEGSASFAVMLQRIESSIFIDVILERCYKKGLKVLSKHDSILCRRSDKHVVTAIICRVLNELFGRNTYSLDIDGEVYEIKERKASRWKKAVFAAATLFSGSNRQGNAPPAVRFRRWA